VARVPNRGSPPAILLRESYREGGKVKNRTLANLSHWPEHKVDTLKRALKGLPPAIDLSEAFEITRSLPHGHVAAVLGHRTATGHRRTDRPGPVTSARSGDRDADRAGDRPRLQAGVRARAAHRNRTSSLGQALGVSGCDEDDLYAAMDWGAGPQGRHRKRPCRTAFGQRPAGALDVSSAAFEGRTCPLGAIGHPRDGVKGRLQIVYGLLCTPAGIPIGSRCSRATPPTRTPCAAQINKLKNRFGLSRVCLVGDRGLLTNARIRDEVRPAQLDWISALRAPQIKALVEEGALQLSLFDEQDLFEISSPQFPGERLVCCHNPALAEQRTRKRQELLAATEKETHPHRGRHPQSYPAIAGQGHDRAAGRQGHQPLQMAKHFTLEITRRVVHVHPQPRRDCRRGRPRRHLPCCAPACPTTPSNATMWCWRYKGLEDVERFFRTLNSELDVRPIRHRLADRVRAHMFLRMLSYYLVWHL